MINGTMPSLYALTKVQSFDISQNHISGSLPSFGNLTSLTYLYLNLKKLVSFSISFRHSQNLAPAMSIPIQ